MSEGFLSILFEDEDLLVLDKSAGVVVNEAESAKDATLQSWARDQLSSWGGGKRAEWQSLVPREFVSVYGSPEELFSQRAGMVHRLDKETSGIVIWAKNPGSLVSLLQQFQARTVKKMYSALVHGVIKPPEGEMTAPIGRLPWQKGKFGVLAGGRSASTKYAVALSYHLDESRLLAAAKQKKLFAGRSSAKVKEQLADYFEYSLVHCYPKTGRTHQIRVHMQHIHHPLVGDNLYQGNKRIRLDSLWCPRHFLHASSIQFSHPRTRDAVHFQAPLPLDLQEAMDWLEPTTSSN